MVALPHACSFMTVSLVFCTTLLEGRQQLENCPSECVDNEDKLHAGTQPNEHVKGKLPSQMC